MIKIFTFIFFCLGIQLFSQNKPIDSLLSQSFDAFSQMRMIQSIKFANNALQLSKAQKYDYGIAKSSLYLAKVLNTIGNNDMAMVHLNELIKTKAFKNDYILKAENHRIRGKIYSNLHLYNLAILEFNKQLKTSKDIKDQNKRNLSLIFGHENLVQVYNFTNQLDSIKTHILLQEDIIKKYREENIYYYLSTLYVQKADFSVNMNDLIESEKYLKKSLFILNKYNSNNTVFTYTSLGDLKVHQKKIIEAEEYYLKGLSNAILIKNNDAKSIIYKKLALLYSSNEKFKLKSIKYFQLFHKTQDSILIANRNVQNQVLQELINTKKEDGKNNLLTLAFSILICSTIGGSTSLFIYKKYKHLLIQYKLQDNDLTNEMSLVHFDKLVNLAKQNNPEFVVFFTELYPAVVNNLKSLDPNIKTTELSFLAMAFLNFSTKEISEYTFVTVRAVQIRKNRLRKKYNIASDLDFNLWIQNLNI